MSAGIDRAGELRSLCIKYLQLSAILIAANLMTEPSLANNAGENATWQFRTVTDQANSAAIQDMIQKKGSGYYAAPVYTTNIGQQYNCSITAMANGNQGTTSAVANSPSTSGASSSSTGNSNGSTIDGLGYTSGGSASANSNQSNGGAVRSEVNGSTTSSVRGNASQVLNSSQNNSGAQTASVQGASACRFGGALN